MNASKAIELSAARLIRVFCELGEGATVRAWQSPNDDGVMEPERIFPLVDVRCDPPAPDDSRHTYQASCRVGIGTNADDDRSRVVLSKMYEEIEAVLLAVHEGDVYQTQDERYQYFISSMQELMPGVQIGAIMYTGGAQPSDEAGINTIGLSFAVHFARQQ